MSPLASSFFQLNANARRRVHFRLAALALEQWETFCTNNGTIKYRDSVVGLTHVLDPRLPGDAINASRSDQVVTSVRQRYLEPIVAMQDDDLESVLPSNVQFAYYGIYNLFNKYAEQDSQIDDWLIVNQCLSSLPESTWDSVLHQAIAEAEN